MHKRKEDISCYYGILWLKRDKNKEVLSPFLIYCFIQHHLAGIKWSPLQKKKQTDPKPIIPQFPKSNLNYSHLFLDFCVALPVILLEFQDHFLIWCPCCVTYIFVVDLFTSIHSIFFGLINMCDTNKKYADIANIPGKNFDLGFF